MKNNYPTWLLNSGQVCQNQPTWVHSHLTNFPIIVIYLFFVIQWTPLLLFNHNNGLSQSFFSCKSSTSLTWGINFSPLNMQQIHQAFTIIIIINFNLTHAVIPVILGFKDPLMSHCLLLPVTKRSSFKGVMKRFFKFYGWPSNFIKDLIFSCLIFWKLLGGEKSKIKLHFF